MMKKSTRWSIVGGAAVVGALGLLGGGLASSAIAQSDPPEVDTPITGTALEQASAAALAVTGGGTVTDTEVGDEESYYEVEVTLPGGKEVDVQLDEAFGYVETTD